MLRWLNKHKVRLFLNLIALWLFLFEGTYSNARQYEPAPGMEVPFLLHVIAYNLIFVIAIYINTLWFMPRYFITKKYLKFSVAFICLLLTVCISMSRYNYWLLHHFKGVESWNFSSVSIGLKDANASWVEYYWSTLPSILLTLFFFAIGYLTQQYFKVKRQQEIISKKQIETELSLLKSQINPHFLFNVLNSIYALSLKKSDSTPEVVLKLSEILRYMLYETRHEKVALEKEIDMIENYIEIEKIRVSNQQQINLEIKGDFAGYTIAPVILIPFVENAVKHGLDSMSENAFVHINIRIENGVLQFYCQNNFKEINIKRHGGIGLDNVQKRLELIYRGKYELQVKNENAIFTVTLNLQLN